MKSNLDLVNDCDQFPPNRDTSLLYKFMIDGYDCPFGLMLDKIVKTFSWPGFWEVNHERRTVKLLGTKLSERNRQMHDTLIAEKEKGSFKILGGWANEMFPIYGPQKELLFSIERAAAPLFGILTYGVQLLAYQEDTGDGSMTRLEVAYQRGKRLSNGLVRESAEEACFPKQLVLSKAKACGTVNYVCRTDERGGGELELFTPEVQFIYEMKLPKDVVPIPGDNEAEEIALLSIDQVKTALEKGEFTPAHGCIVLDFFIRHGILTYENEKHYIEIASRLHRTLEFPTG